MVRKVLLGGFNDGKFLEHPLMVPSCNSESRVLLRDSLLRFVLNPSF